MKSPEQFLHKKNPELHTSRPVEHEKKEKELRGEKTSQKPADKIADWLKAIEKPHTSHRDDPRVLERIKEYYHREYVITEEDIPESYFENQARLAREQGYGDIEIEGQQRKESSEIIINDQKSTLNKWIEYFTSEDSDSYPMWAKYWVFTNMTKLSSYDKGKKVFTKRDKSTVAPFPDLNREALAYVVDAVIKKVGKEDIDIEDEEFKKLVEGANFGKLYAYAIEKITPTEESELVNTKGEWIKYNQRADHMPLVKSLQGHGTGWCTAGESTAETQLKNGDFYVYYSYDKDGSPTIPRVAIRMNGNHEIAEVRGIAKEQNIDPYIGEVVDQKLENFGKEGEYYKKKSADMKRLTTIDNRQKAGEELSTEELRFLYEFDDNIEGFGYQKDPRIKEILDSRNIKADLVLITDYREDEISTTKEEALNGNIKFHYGDLDLDSLQSAEGLTLPESVGGYLDLRSLQSAEGLTLPESVGGYLNLDSLQSAEGLTLPESVGGGFNLRSLQSAEGLTLPESVGGYLDLGSLQSAEGLTLPESVGGGFNLRSLQSAEGLSLPKSVGGDLDLGSLQSAEGLSLPENLGGYLNLGSLQSAKGLSLPKSLGGSLNLDSLQSAEGLSLPKSVGGSLYLRGLQSAEGLKLPKSMDSFIFFEKITKNEKEILKNKYPNHNIV